MRRVLRCVGLALALTILPAAVAQDKEKKPDAEKAPAKDDKNLPKDQKEAVEKMHVGGEISGKLTQWGASDKSFTVQVTVTYYVLNEGEYKAMLQSQLDAAKAKNIQDRYNAMKAMADHQAKLYTAKKENVDVHFRSADEMKVRVLTPMVYDDKGKPKKLTRKELDELKGPDKKLPGYTADVADVHQDSIVTAYLPKKKAGTKPAVKDEKGLVENKPEAIMLLIISDAPPKP